MQTAIQKEDCGELTTHFTPYKGECLTIYDPYDNSDNAIHSIVIVREVVDDDTIIYDVQHYEQKELYYNSYVSTIDFLVRPSIPSEILSLTVALEKEGKKWNPTTRQIEKLSKSYTPRFLAPRHIKMLKFVSEFEDARYGDNLFIPFNNSKQALGYYNGIWVSYKVCKQSFTEVDYHLEPCETGDLKEGETFFYSLEKYNPAKAKITNFCKKLSKNKSALVLELTDLREAVTTVEKELKNAYTYKIVPSGKA